MPWMHRGHSLCCGPVNTGGALTIRVDQCSSAAGQHALQPVLAQHAAPLELLGVIVRSMRQTSLSTTRYSAYRLRNAGLFSLSSRMRVLSSGNCCARSRWCASPTGRRNNSCDKASTSGSRPRAAGRPRPCSVCRDRRGRHGAVPHRCRASGAYRSGSPRSGRRLP